MCFFLGKWKFIADLFYNIDIEKNIKTYDVEKDYLGKLVFIDLLYS